jgi:hypothetical protein
MPAIAAGDGGPGGTAALKLPIIVNGAAGPAATPCATPPPFRGLEFVLSSGRLTQGESMKALLFAAIAALCLPLMAQEGLKVGDEAVDIEVSNWVNTPAMPSLTALRGDVILIKAWGIN